MKAQIPWLRVFVEGVVIVASILLAFGLQAWWESAQEGAVVERQLTVLQVEMASNSSVLENASSFQDRALAATRVLVELIAPQPVPVSADSLSSLLGWSFSIGTAEAELELGALDALLSSGEFGTSSRGDLYSSIVAFRARTEVYRNLVALYIEASETLINYLVTVAPMAAVSALTEAHGPTDFPVPVDDLLQDRQLEGLVGTLAVRIRNVNVLAQELIARADSIRVLLASDGAT